MALAIWMLVDPTFYVSMVQDTNDYLISTYILLVAGILLMIVGFIGCCGSFKESSCLLITVGKPFSSFVLRHFVFFVKLTRTVLIYYYFLHIFLSLVVSSTHFSLC